MNKHSKGFARYHTISGFAHLFLIPLIALVGIVLIAFLVLPEDKSAPFRSFWGKIYGPQTVEQSGPNSPSLSDTWQEETLEVDTADWETYYTTLFSLKYPHDISVSRSSGRDNISIDGTTNTISKEEFFDRVNLDIDTQHPNNKDLILKISPIQKIQIDNKPAYLRKIYRASQIHDFEFNHTQIAIENVNFYNNDRWHEDGTLFIRIEIDGNETNAGIKTKQILSTIEFNEHNKYQELPPFMIGDLTFVLPNTWWYEYDLNQASNNEWYKVKTKSNGDYSYSSPDFTIEYDPRKTTITREIFEMNQQHFDKYYDWEKEENVLVNGIKATRKEIKRNDKFEPNSYGKPNAIIAEVRIVKDDATYSLSGVVTTTELRQNFNQILSTFEFVE